MLENSCDSKGRLTLGPANADRDVTVVHEGARLIIEPVVLIPESEAWLYRNARAKNSSVCPQQT